MITELTKRRFKRTGKYFIFSFLCFLCAVFEWSIPVPKVELVTITGHLAKPIDFYPRDRRSPVPSASIKLHEYPLFGFGAVSQYLYNIRQVLKDHIFMGNVSSYGDQVILIISKKDADFLNSVNLKNYDGTQFLLKTQGIDFYGLSCHNHTYFIADREGDFLKKNEGVANVSIFIGLIVLFIGLIRWIGTKLVE